MSSSPTTQARRANTLPDPASLPLFQYNAGLDNDNEMVDVVYNTNEYITPRMSNFVIDTADWTPQERGSIGQEDEGTNAGSKLSNILINAILGVEVGDAERCEICQQETPNCTGQFCITTFQAMVAHNEIACLELRKVGANEMGLGVFAKCDIPQGTLLSEYTGRLLPMDETEPKDWGYSFLYPGSVYCDASQYGSVSRFVNHHCKKFNVEVEHVVYGRRKVLGYMAKRDIAKNDQLFITYGEGYFTADKPCQCDAEKNPHVPGDKKPNKKPNKAAVHGTQTGPENSRQETVETKSKPEAPMKEAEESKKSKTSTDASKDKKEGVISGKVEKPRRSKQTAPMRRWPHRSSARRQ